MALGLEIITVSCFLTFVCGCMWFFHNISQRIEGIELKITASTDNMERLNGSGDMLETLKDSLEDIIADTLENIQPPSAFDHIAGAIGQMIQMKMMKSMDMLPPQIVEGLNDLNDD